jgi:peptidoglycan/LPS O-acetylase OafA/YrhL
MAQTGKVQTVHQEEIEPQGSAKSAFRGDIQGLRAVAVVLVMLWHAGLSVLPGGFVGVDVFFVISGFLMTGLLYREASADGNISLPHFYARRARRLLPASALLIIFVAVSTRVFLPPVRWASIGKDLLASSFFGMNWRLSSLSTDYMVSTSGIASPLQHFWSLGVEEQFYFIWPVLLLLFTIRARRRRGSLTSGVALLLAAVTIPSLLWSIHLSSSDPGSAYFVTTTRLWELAVGGAVAVFAPHLRRIPTLLAVAVGWVGLAAAVAAGFIYNSNTTFPGYAAVLPVLGTAAVIAAGPAAGTAGPVALLGWAPFRKIGDWSYSLYLWHWPLIVIAAAEWGDLSQSQGLAVVAFSFVPALLAFYLVEEPARTARGMRKSADALKSGGTILLASSMVALVFLVFTPTVLPAIAVRAASADSKSLGVDPGSAVKVKKFGAQVLGASPLGDPAGIAVDSPGVFTPQPGQKEDGPAGCIATPTVNEVKTCDVGDRFSSVHVVLVGDSHAAQWISALDVVAQKRNWRLTVVTKDSCPYANVRVSTSSTASCEVWKKNVAAYLAAQRPAVLIASQSTYVVSTTSGLLDVNASALAMAEGLRSNYATLIAAGTKVLVLRDTPRPDINIGDCVSGNSGHLKNCAIPRSHAVGPAGVAQIAAVKRLAGASLIDLDNAICPDDPCAPVIGGVLVYYDGNHMTQTYGLSLAPRLLSAFDTALPVAG